jgi:23S rRNA pseudouridine2605 synthase
LPRTYLVTVRGSLDEDTARRLVGPGVEDAGERLVARELLVRKRSGRESHVTVVLTEGKNRELRRMFAVVGHPVTRLRRVAFGAIELGDLPPGQVRDLDPEQV